MATPMLASIASQITGVCSAAVSRSATAGQHRIQVRQPRRLDARPDVLDPQQHGPVLGASR
jgi:hypothetical protein